MQFHSFARVSGTMSRLGRLALPLASLAMLALAGCGDDGRGGTTTPTLCGATECAAGNLCCGEACVNGNIDPNNCGACGVACGADQYCNAGTCADRGTTMMDAGTPAECTGCSADQNCCGGRCTNASVPSGTDGRGDESFANCNGCGVACNAERATSCSVGPSGTPQCMCGDLPQCAAGSVCTESGGTFICSNVNFDPMNCGEIGNTCTSGESCVGGMCQCGSSGAACGAGQGCCNGECVDITSDAMNCGDCGNVCGTNAPNCNLGSCGCGAGPACDAPTSGGGSALPIPLPIPIPGLPGGETDLGQSCCDGACVDNTDSNCGCGVACEGDETCQVGGSGIALPIPGMGGDPSDEQAATVCCGDDSTALLGCDGFAFPGI